MTLLISSIAPALIIMFLVYQHDLKKEPIQMLVKAFFGGILSILITLAIALPLGYFEKLFAPGFARSFYTAFFCAGIPEELGKWLIFYWLIRNSRDFDQYYDGILYAIFISMGFALVENILYVMDSNGGMGTATARAIFSVPGHMLFVIPMGYYLSVSKFEEGKDAKRHQILSLVIPIALHGTFDFILFYSASNAEINPGLASFLVLGFVAFNIFMWRLGLKKIKAHITKDKTFIYGENKKDEITID
jgi:RsiW-degrading membrane proteinase PrsW (M82 family)